MTVITPTVAGREGLLAECQASVEAAKLPHLVEVDHDREGPAVVRNRLLERVESPWVVFLDDDDLIEAHYWQVVARHARDADVVYTAWRLEGAAEPKPYPEFDPDLLERANFIPVTACVRTAAVRSVGGFPTGERLEDHALWLALHRAGYRFRYVPIIGWTYRRFPGSRTEVAV